MKLAGPASAHLTYCSNIHPGETWAEVRANLERYVTAVKQRVAPATRFGIGLRLSNDAARTLAAPAALESFRAWLDDNAMYVFTINGFPYGSFHATRVKESVYRPDWREPARVGYSDVLAELLAALLPDDVAYGSVSTVPGAYRERARSELAVEEMTANLIDHAATLVDIERRTGKSIRLAIEPEPCCVLETVDETVAYFERCLLSVDALAQLGRPTGLAADDAEAALRRHVGVCLDTCHAAVEFESAPDAVARFEQAGIGIFKLQLSAGLRVAAADETARTALAAFADDVYLHQVVARRGADLQRFVDLPDALATEATDTRSDEWRVHFHVPLFRERLGAFETTQGFVREILVRQCERAICEHLEVETYTWDVLPERFRGEDVVPAVARELDWVLDQLGVRP